MGDPANSMVNDNQAGSLGGADKKAGAHGDNTYETAHERQLLIIARYKPAPTVFSADGMASAGGLLSSVTGAIEKATNAVEDAMASIPGLQMFIKEDKKDSPSAKEYKYDYTEWDSKISSLDKNIKKVYKENKAADIFDFSDTDIDGRKQAASKLYNSTVKSSLGAWKGYKARLHLIGIGQGGNVINELSDLLAKDAQFKSEDWLVKSIFYIGTPFYADFHKLNNACLKSQGEVFNFNCTLDLTQRVIAYMSPADDLLKFIQNSNSNTLSLAVGKIKLTIVKILSLFLGNSTISIDNPDGLDKFGQIKPEIENLVKQMTGMIKQIASEIAAFIDPGKLPDFGAALDGFSQIPSQTGDAFSKFLDNLTKTIGSQAKNIFTGGGGLGPQNLMGVFNCLCPLLDQITKAIAVFDYESPATIALANQMIDNAGITEIYGKGETPGNETNLDNAIASDYLQERLKKYQQEGKIDKINQLVTDATKLFDDIGKIKVKDLGDDKKMQLASALYSMVQPMLISKKMVLDELQKWIAKLDFGSALKDISANKLFSFPGNALNSFANLQFEQPLNDSINKVDDQLNRLKGYLGPRDYDLHRDTLYFIYDIHNQVINPFFDDIQYYIDKQTGFIDYMHDRGSENQFSITHKNTYNPEAQADPDDILSTTKLPSK
jgi:hypothetical protein